MSVNCLSLFPGFPLAPASPMITVACVTIGLLVLVIIMYTYHKDRRKMKKSRSSQETADFHFHAFQTGSFGAGSSFQQSFEIIRQKVLSWMPNSWRVSSSESNDSIRNFRVLNLPEDSRVLQMPNYGAINSADDEVL